MLPFSVNHKTSAVILLLLIVLVGPVWAGATKSAKPTPKKSSAPAVQKPKEIVPDTSRVIIRVEKRFITNRRINDTLLVSLETFGRPLAGFDLKFGTDSPYLNIVKVLPGRFYDSCGWQFFTAHQVKTLDRSGYPRQLWQAVALAQMATDSSKPRCFGLDRESSLLKIVLSNEHVMQMPETTAAIFFFWEDCTDNVISGLSGSELMVSLSVMDYFSTSHEETGGGFPTRRGAPRNCVNPAAVFKPIRVIEFNNGGVDFRYRGDQDHERPATIPALTPVNPNPPDSHQIKP
jgi:hypothetical protein